MRDVVLGDSLLELIDYRGKTPKKLGTDFTESGVPVASAMLVSNGVLDLSSARFVSPETYEAWMKIPLRQGDVLLTSEAPLGRIGRVSSDEPLVLGQRLYALRGRPNVLDNGYLYYVLQTNQVQADLVGRSSGTTVFGIRQSALRQVRIPAPPIRMQKAIAEVLGALDDKIAANTKLAQSADDLQRTCFRSLLGNTAQLPLSDTAQFVNGKAFTKNATGTGRMVVRIAELNSGPGDSTVYKDVNVDDKHVAHPGDILFAWSGSLTLHRWHRNEAIVNQHIFKVIPNDGFPDWLVFELIRHKLDDFKAVAADKATTMGHIQRRHLDELVAMPSQQEISTHHAQLNGLYDIALRAHQENINLAELRDTLLPQLMSGKLQVKDAEAIVEGAI